MSYQSVLRPGLFEGQVFIVTGGGSGIGRCTAHELAALGARVALVGRKQEKVDAVKAEIEEDGGIASAHACDIREQDLRCADITGRLVAADMLFTRLQGQTIGGLAVFINRHADNASRHCAFVIITCCKERCMRTAKAKRHTKTLG